MTAAAAAGVTHPEADDVIPDGEGLAFRRNGDFTYSQLISHLFGFLHAQC